MRYSIRVAPGVRLRPSSRGIGVSLGKGRNWLFLGPTGAGATTSVGPVRFYQWRGGSRARRPRLSQYEAQNRAVQQGQDLQALAARVQHMLSLHRQEFPAAQPPVAPPAEPVDEQDIERRCLGRGLAGISWFKRKERKAAKERAQAEAAREIAEEQKHRDEIRAGLQRELDEHWKLLCENDSHTVMETLEAAFAENTRRSCLPGTASRTNRPPPGDALSLQASSKCTGNDQCRRRVKTEHLSPVEN